MLAQLRELRVRSQKMDGLVIDPLGDTLDGVDNWWAIYRNIYVAKIYYRIGLVNKETNQIEYEHIWSAKMVKNLYRIIHHAGLEIEAKYEKDSIKNLINCINNCWIGPIDTVLDIRDEENSLLDEIPF